MYLIVSSAVSSIFLLGGFDLITIIVCTLDVFLGGGEGGAPFFLLNL